MKNQFEAVIPHEVAPHFTDGLCNCSCEECSDFTALGEPLCICVQCDAEKCGLHGG